jgi:hypothetical protein
MSALTAIASTVEESLRVLSNFMDLIPITPGRSWSTVISRFIRIVKVFIFFFVLGSFPTSDY